MIPLLFEKDVNTFDANNGLGLLPDVMDSYAYEVGNGEYELFLEYPTNVPKWEELKEVERQILYKPSTSRDPHAFRIYSYEFSIDRQSIYIYAQTRANDLASTTLSNAISVKNMDVTQALFLLSGNIQGGTDFTFYSDITTPSSTEWDFRTPLSCIMGEEGSIIQYWGGEVLRENNRISVYSRIGKDKVTTLRLGKNIQGLNYKLDISDVVTAIRPYFKYTPEGDGLAETTYFGDIVYSGKRGNFSKTYYRDVDFSDNEIVTAVKEKYEQEVSETVINADLEATVKTYTDTSATNWFSEHPYADEPRLNIDVDMLDISGSTEYKEFLRQLETVNVFDTVLVYVEEYGIDIEIKVLALKYDGVNERNLEIELGNAKSTLYDSTTEPAIKDLRKQLEELRAKTIVAITSADGKTTNYSGSVDPNVAGLIGNNGDVYFQVSGADEQMWRWLNGQWNIITYKADLLTGEFDASKLTVLNIDVNSLSGNISQFIQSYWNAINSQLSVNGEGLDLIATNGARAEITNLGEFRSTSVTGTNNYALLGNGRSQYYGDLKGSLFYIGAGLESDRRDKAGIYVTHEERFDIGRYDAFSTSGGVFHPYASLEYEAGDTTFDETNGIYRVLKKLVLNKDISFRGASRNITGANILSFQYGGYIESLSNSDMMLVASSDLLAYASNSLAYKIDSGYMYLNRNLSMEGNTITNQSDSRLKTNIISSDKQVLSDYETMRFVEYEWIDDNKPDGTHFGLIAQETPLLSVYDAENDVWSINSSDQIMYNSKAIQELHEENKTLKQELSDLRQELSDLKQLLINKGVI